MIIFCITSENFLKYTESFLESLNKNITPLVSGVHCLGINLSNKTIGNLKSKITNTKIEIQNIEIDFSEKKYNLPGYAVCARAIFLPQLIRKYKKDIMYVDCDVCVLSHVDGLYEHVKGSDWAVGIRHPCMHPDTNEQLVGVISKDLLDRAGDIHLNAGVIYVKYSENNLKYIDVYRELVLKNGISWMTDQSMLEKLLTLIATYV